MKNILIRVRALFRFARRPDPLDLIIAAFALDPFRRKRADESKGD